jgi:hypothetical protein
MTEKEGLSEYQWGAQPENIRGNYAVKVPPVTSLKTLQFNGLLAILRLQNNKFSVFLDGMKCEAWREHELRTVLKYG